nr:hypothetical protein [Tanacetum cinerariifolium]
MSFSQRPGKNTPQCYTKPLDSLKNWNNRFFWVDERVFPTVVDWRMNAPKDGMPAEGTYSIKAVRALDTHHIDLFNLIRAPNPTMVKIGSRPRAPHEVPLLTLTANRVIEMDDLAAATDSSGVPSTIERSPLDFALEAGASDQGTAAPEMPPSEDVPTTVASGTDQAEEVAAADPPAAVESCKRGRDGIDSLAAIQLGLASTASVPEDAPTCVSDPDPLSFADPPARPPADVAQSSQGIAVVGDPEPENASSPAEAGSPGSVYRPEWSVTNDSLLDNLRHAKTWQYNVNLARQVAMGSQLRLRFEQETKLLRKSVAQVARRDKRIQTREPEIKNLEVLLETEAGMKKAAEDKSAGLIKEFEDMRARRPGGATVHGVGCASGCTKHRLDEELYPHMLTATAGRRWVIGHGLRLAVMKCDESLEMRQAFADVVSARIAKGMSEGLRHGALKDLKYPLLDQLEGLKDAPTDVIMAALYLENDTGEDAPQYIRDLRLSSSHLTIPVYPKVRDPRNPWAYKEEMKLADAITPNISRAEKKKKCRIVCRTHGVGSAHHAQSDGVLVSVPTVVPQGLALLLADVASQTEFKDT